MRWLAATLRRGMGRRVNYCRQRAGRRAYEQRASINGVQGASCPLMRWCVRVEALTYRIGSTRAMRAAADVGLPHWTKVRGAAGTAECARNHDARREAEYGWRLTGL